MKKNIQSITLWWKNIKYITFWWKMVSEELPEEKLWRSPSHFKPRQLGGGAPEEELPEEGLRRSPRAAHTYSAR